MSDPTMVIVKSGDLVPDETNLRQIVSVPELRELATSIDSSGILQPLRVFPNGDGTFHIISGHRRWAAVRLLEEADPNKVIGIPVMVVPFDSTDKVKIEQLIENIQRSDLDPIEEAFGFQALQDAGRKIKDIVALVGKSQSHISKRLALLKLPEVCWKALRDGYLGLDEAYQLSKFAHYTAEVEAMVGRYVDEKRHVNAKSIDELGQKLEKAEQRMRIIKVLEERGVMVQDVTTIDTKTLERIEVIEPDELPDAVFTDADIVTVELPSYGFPKVTRWGERVKGSTEPSNSQLAERERNKALRDAKMVRLENAQLVARRPAKGAVGELLAVWVATQFSQNDAKTICQILVLEPRTKVEKAMDKDGNEVEKEVNDWAGTLKDEISDGSVSPHRAALAVLLTHWVNQGPATKEVRRWNPAYAALSDYVDNLASD